MTLHGQKIKSPFGQLCQIIREQEYEEGLSAMVKDYHRMEEIDSAIDWALSRGPVYFYDLGEGYYIYKNEGVSNFPDFRLLYRFDEELKTVYLLTIEPYTSDDE